MMSCHCYKENKPRILFTLEIMLIVVILLLGGKIFHGIFLDKEMSEESGGKYIYLDTSTIMNYDGRLIYNMHLLDTETMIPQDIPVYSIEAEIRVKEILKEELK